MNTEQIEDIAIEAGGYYISANDLFLLHEELEALSDGGKCSLGCVLDGIASAACSAFIATNNQAQEYHASFKKKRKV